MNYKNEFSFKNKKRWQDHIKIGNEVRKIGYWMTFEPLLLWKTLYTRGSKLSLCNDVYKVLYDKIKEIAPEEIERLERKKRYHKSKEKFRKHEGRFMWLRKSDVKVVNRV